MLTKPRIGRSRMYDVLHKGVVLTCLGVSVVGFCISSVMGYSMIMGRGESTELTDKELFMDEPPKRNDNAQEV